MSRRIFDVDPLTGLTRYFHGSDDGESFTIETVYDVEPIIEDNKELLMGESSKGRRWQGDMHRVASIPMNVFMELELNGTTKDPKKMRAWLNDRDNMYYRTKGGRV